MKRHSADNVPMPSASCPFQPSAWRAILSQEMCFSEGFSGASPSQRVLAVSARFWFWGCPWDSPKFFPVVTLGTLEVNKTCVNNAAMMNR